MIKYVWNLHLEESMLVKFKVTGFKNFEKELVLDLSNPGKYDFNTDLVKNKTINKGIIYGPNGSGKSNLGEALFDIENNLLALDNNLNFTSPFSGFYKNTITNQNPEFEYTFQFGNDTVIYHYIKDQPNYVLEEDLSVNGKKVLEYHNDKSKIICSNPFAKKLNFVNMTDGLSPLLYIYRTIKLEKDDPISKLFDFVKGMLWFRCLNKGNEFKGYKESAEIIENKIINENKVKDFQNFLKETANLKYDIKVNKTGRINPLTGEEEKILVAQFNNRNYPLVSLLSTGTQALELFYYWSLCFSDITFLFIDEFDAFYHFELSSKIIKILNSNNNFQSFVTTHNTTLMSNELMRPDCLFIIDKNEIKPVCDLTQKELRQAHNLEKIYRAEGFSF